ncbi:hypothetical protein E0Z10_g4266 [Xylaria hypoxylon]|uniref:Uncharacterized protein n=1 Tax=Xylaria hypoxylon TaxID=37992 RepID=A0A4Z0YZ51_9PEZI|nr:hypothetical protein E0Z10_g4266 [Xylaria hypoxylon]
MNQTNPKDEQLEQISTPPPSSSSEVVEPRYDGVQPGRSLHRTHATPNSASIALLAGSGITAGTTSALVAHILHLIRDATVSSDPQVWMHQAKIKDYDPCYDGCEDCADPEYSYRACLKTAAIESGDPNVTCDGTKIWFWLYRYPPACLSVRGEYYRNIALEKLKRNYKDQLAVLLLTIIGGLVGGVIIHGLWRCCTFRMKQRTEVREKGNDGLPGGVTGKGKRSFSECHDRGGCGGYWGYGGSSCEDAHHLKCDPCTDASCQPPPAELFRSRVRPEDLTGLRERDPPRDNALWLPA